jgi:hypothetical protein
MALAAPQWFAQAPADPANSHIYLLIGQSNMAGRAEPKFLIERLQPLILLGSVPKGTTKSVPFGIYSPGSFHSHPTA